jgi:predicted CXXCH cytochrome family protein
MFDEGKQTMRRLLVLAGLLLTLHLTCGPAAALELLYPLDGTYVTRSSYLVIKGGTDPLLTGMSVEINGVASDVIDISGEEYRAAFGDMLILEPIFDPGENHIVIEGFLNQEKMATVTADVFYSARFDASPPEGLPRELFHLPEREAPCAACHNMDPGPAELATPDPRRNACAACHARMLNRKHVHGPAGVYECTYCHQLDSTPNKYQVRPGDASLCLECHEEKLDEFRQAQFVHGPIEADLCLVCHDAHASDEPAQLVAPAYELCTACHERVGKEPHVVRGSVGKRHPLQGVVNPAGRGEDLSCASCHNPHSGPTKEMFRWGITSRMSLCSKCHNK